MSSARASMLVRNVVLVLVLIVLLVMRFLPPHGSASGGAGGAARASAAATAEPAAAPPAGERFGAGVGFRSEARLSEHFAKHGGEFAALGIHDEQAYLRAAQALRDRVAGGDVLELRREADGVVSRFDRGSGAFLAFETNGTIRTFFRPRDGERYFERQASRAPEDR